MDEQNHATHKNAMGKLYEKYQMIKRFSNSLDVGYCMNNETGRKELVLILKTPTNVFPLGNLWTHHDFELRDYDIIDSEIFSEVFSGYEETDERTTIEDFLDGYHPIDKNYDQLWKMIDEAREEAEEEAREEFYEQE